MPELAGVGRGATVTLAELGEATDTLDVVLDRSARAGVNSVAHAAHVFVHHGTAAVAGRVYLLDREPLTGGGTALAQLRLATAVYAGVGDRLVIRDASQQRTLAGGRVLDVGGQRRGYDRPARRASLGRRVTADLTGFVLAELVDRAAVARPAVLVRSRWSASAIATAVDALVRDGRAVAAGAFVVDADRWATWMATLAEAVDAHHRDRPEHVGVTLADLRAAAGGLVPEAALVDAVVAGLLDGRGFVRRLASVARAGHRPALPPHLAAAGARVRTALAAKPLEPPNRRELTPTATDRAAVQFLIDTGEAVAVGEELVLLASAVDAAAAAVRARVAAGGPASASDLKSAVGTTRRVMVPLLEWFDRHGVTRRVGDLRTLAV